MSLPRGNYRVSPNGMARTNTMAKKLARPAKLSDSRVGAPGAELTGQGALKTRPINVHDICVGARMREVDEAAVDVLSASMAELGLNTPISVRLIPPTSAIKNGENKPETAWVLVAGAHRLAAAKKLGWKTIMSIVVDADDVQAQLWEIAENLHRAELTAQQRADHVAAYVRLREKSGVLSQRETKPLGGRPKGGLRAAARALGIDKSEAARAVKIASISAEVRAAVHVTKLNDHQSALLEIASLPTIEAQLAKVWEIASRRERHRTSSTQGRKPSSEAEPETGSTTIAEQRARAVHKAAFDVLAELLVRRLGKDAHRFVRLSQDTGSNDLLRLANAIEQSLGRHGTAADISAMPLAGSLVAGK
jgi:ParB-like chromosome segregation protein Spo0J